MRVQAVKLGSQTIGRIEGRSFVMKRRGSRHMLQKPRPAWAISEAVFYGDVLPACDEVVVHDEETGTSYHTSTKTFERHHRLIERPPYEPQVALELRHWTVSDGKTPV
ncbi:MAG: hypothetical protein QUS33_05805, partial [Dehalococcoidia bacterium]|nr:hypothetical protein [Dehalococcoidia bacterium]